MMCAFVCWEAQLRVFIIFIFIAALAGQDATCGKCYVELELLVPGVFVGGSLWMSLAADS